MSQKSAAPWADVVHEVKRSGRIPLPAVNSITFADDGTPAIALLAPGIVEASPSVFVDVRGMPAEDRVALDTLLGLLDVVVGRLSMPGAPDGMNLLSQVGQRQRDFWAIYHAGGVDYKFYGPGSLVVQLTEFEPAQQAEVWRLLRSIARLTRSYPDREASTLKAVSPG